MEVLIHSDDRMIRILLLPLVLIAELGAQESIPRFSKLTLEDGLSQSIVFCTYQDAEGFLWFGTQDGLNRYDGYEFVIFRHDPGEELSLTNNWINHVSGAGNWLWVCTSGGGLNLFDPAKNRAQVMRHRAGDPLSIPSDNVTHMLRDRKGVYWVATATGLRLLDSANQSFHFPEVLVPSAPELERASITRLMESADGSLWIATETMGLYRLTSAGNVERYAPGLPGRALSRANITALAEDAEGRIWAGSDQGVNMIDLSSGTLRVFYAGAQSSETADRILSLYCDGQNQVWIGTSGAGIRILREVRVGEFQSRTLVHDPLDPESLIENRVWNFYEDRSRILWIGTGNGLSKFDRKPAKFITYRKMPSNPNSLSHNQVWAVMEDRDHILWVGTTQGLNRIDRTQGEFRHFRHDPNRPHTLSDDRVWAIHEGEAPTLWIGTNGGGLNQFDRTNGHVVRYLADGRPGSISHPAVRAIISAGNNDLWIATRGGGLNYFDHNHRRFIAYRHDPNDSTSLSHDDAYSLFVDKNGNLWVGTAGGGLNRLNPDLRTFTRYVNNPRDKSTISYDRVLAINQDRSGTLWIATGEGLNEFDPKKRTFRRYYSNDGLPSNFVYAILEDRDGNLWMSTNHGICKMIRKGDHVEFRTYDKTDGLQGNEFNGNAYFQSRGGEMFFGGTDGLNSFFPDLVTDNPYVPPVALTGFRIFDRPQPLERIDPVSGIRLSHRENFVAFEFVGLEFTSPRHNQFAFRLEGFDEDWIFAGNRRFANYTNLDGGNYVFRIRAANNNGVWNEQGISIPVTVVPAFWNTWSFRIVAVSAILLGAFVFYRRKIREEKERNEILERKVAERTQTLQEMNLKILEADRLKSEFLANMSHELRTPLNAIIGFSELLMEDLQPTGSVEQVESLRDIHSSGKHLLQLINDLLDLSKIESGKMELYKDWFRLEEILSSVHHTLLPLFERKKQRFTWELSPDLPLLYGDPARIKQVMINLASNAHKFSGEQALIHVTAGLTEDHHAFVSVHDEGSGIAKEHLEIIFDHFRQVDGSSTREGQGTGLGLALCRQLMRMHGGDIRVESEIGKGSTFTITLPLNRDVRDVRPHRPEVVPSVDQPLVLIVEDDMQSYQLLRRYLENAGFRTQHTSNGLNALADAKALRPSVITLDIMLPGKDGWQILQELKSDPLTATIPVLVVSIVENKDLAFRLNAADYFVKPIDRHMFTDRIRRLTDFQGGDSKRVLVVDDDEHCIDMMKYLLERDFYDIRSAEDGLDALRVLQEFTPDLIILDLMMPKMNGFQLLEHLRADAKLRDIPVIVLTAKDLTEQEMISLKQHVRSVMNKATYNMRDLLAEVIRLTRQPEQAS